MFAQQSNVIPHKGLLLLYNLLWYKNTIFVHTYKNTNEQTNQKHKQNKKKQRKNKQTKK